MHTILAKRGLERIGLMYRKTPYLRMLEEVKECTVGLTCIHISRRLQGDIKCKFNNGKTKK